MKKWTCQVFTPPPLVEDMLDKIGYTESLSGKKILENSCGEGVFLKEIVRRYIIDARRRGISEEELRAGLEADVSGIEKDARLLKRCVKELDRTAAELQIEGVRWNLQKGDALRRIQGEYYDYVIGNPPYITYYNLSQRERKFIKKNFESCGRGKPDYYYAFTEAALQSLKPGGKLAYLIPNNFMKNQFSDQLRNYLLPHLTGLVDYRDQKVFKDILTSSAIVFCEKDGAGQQFLYEDIPNGRTLLIDKDCLNGKWAFFLPRKSEKAVKYKNLFQVSAPVATLLNEVFVLKDVTKVSDKYIFCKEHYFERDSVRKAASPKTKQDRGKKKGRIKGETYIIFPYFYTQENKLQRYAEEDYRKNFPQTYAYLMGEKERLLKRKSDPKSQWFEYGRSQALAHINQEKLLLSTLITDKVRYYRLDRETVPFSGMYIVPREGQSLDEAERILRSRKFLEYIKEIGISVSGASYRISPRDVQEYVVRQKG